MVRRAGSHSGKAVSVFLGLSPSFRFAFLGNALFVRMSSGAAVSLDA